jgi:hypothetical protein
MSRLADIQERKTRELRRNWQGWHGPQQYLGLWVFLLSEKRPMPAIELPNSNWTKSCRNAPSATMFLGCGG